jgi:hypothetical protein
MGAVSVTFVVVGEGGGGTLAVGAWCVLLRRLAA